MGEDPSLLDDRARLFWAQTTLFVWPAHYLLVSLQPDLLAEAAALAGSALATFVALVMERDEVSLTVEEDLWLASPLRPRARAESGPYRAITLDVNVELDMVGYLAPAALALAEAGISIIPQCAYLKDHLLVHETSLDRAIRTLNDLIQTCRNYTGRHK
jgi:hypothetical protein